MHNMATSKFAGGHQGNLRLIKLLTNVMTTRVTRHVYMVISVAPPRENWNYVRLLFMKDLNMKWLWYMTPDDKRNDMLFLLAIIHVAFKVEIYTYISLHHISILTWAVGRFVVQKVHQSLFTSWDINNLLCFCKLYAANPWVIIFSDNDITVLLRFSPHSSSERGNPILTREVRGQNKRLVIAIALMVYSTVWLSSLAFGNDLANQDFN